MWGVDRNAPSYVCNMATHCVSVDQSTQLRDGRLLASGCSYGVVAAMGRNILLK